MDLDENNLGGSGFCFNILHYLWLEDPVRQKNIKINLPHTIKFHLGEVRHWYYSFKGRVLRKKQENMNWEEVIKKLKLFQQNYRFINDSDVVNNDQVIAVYYEGTTQAFLDRQQFIQFAQSKNPSYSGVLQSFIQSKNKQCDSMIKVIWSHHMLLSEVMETNQANRCVGMFDQILGVNEKSGGKFNVQKIMGKPFLGRQVPNEIDHLLKIIQIHIFNINSKFMIKQTQAYWKIDAQETLWLIGFENIIIQGQLTDNKNRIKFELIQKNLFFQEQAKKELLCPICNLYSIDDKIKIKINDFIQADLLDRKNVQIKSVQTKKAFSLKSVPLQIPQTIKKVYPNLGNKQYQQIKSNPILINEEITVCENCWLKTTQNSRFNESMEGLVSFYQFGNQKHVSNPMFISNFQKPRATQSAYDFDQRSQSIQNSRSFKNFKMINKTPISIHIPKIYMKRNSYSDLKILEIQNLLESQTEFQSIKQIQKIGNESLKQSQLLNSLESSKQNSSNTSIINFSDILRQCKQKKLANIRINKRFI